MKFLKIAVVIAVAGVLAAFGLAALGDSDESEPESTTVRAELGEASPDNFFLRVDKSEVKAGRVTFEVENVGKVLHEFIVYKTHRAPSDLQVDEKADRAVLGSDRVLGEVHVGPAEKGAEEDDHAEGDDHGGEEFPTEDSLTLDLKPGRYVLLCNIPGHYSKKQYIAFTVVE